MTKAQALTKARKTYEKTGVNQYVVFDPSHPQATDRQHSYFTTDFEGMCTWYDGLHEDAIIAGFGH